MKYKFILIILLTAFWGQISNAAPTPYSTTIKGKLDKVIDGDTIRIEGHKVERVNL